MGDYGLQYYVYTMNHGTKHSINHSVNHRK